MNIRLMQIRCENLAVVTAVWWAGGPERSGEGPQKEAPDVPGLS